MRLSPTLLPHRERALNNPEHGNAPEGVRRHQQRPLEKPRAPHQRDDGKRRRDEQKPPCLDITIEEQQRRRNAVGGRPTSLNAMAKPKSCSTPTPRPQARGRGR
ncbi:MAG TPA: hypothetical protein VNO52_00605 [Methylomirabilota bacterium]|nr:hypothetical protein [Methylomirabilota bacterium]